MQDKNQTNNSVFDILFYDADCNRNMIKVKWGMEQMEQMEEYIVTFMEIRIKLDI